MSLKNKKQHPIEIKPWTASSSKPLSLIRVERWLDNGHLYRLEQERITQDLGRNPTAYHGYYSGDAVVKTKLFSSI